MHSTIELWVIKGRPKEVLEDNLLSYKKDKLLELAACHEVELKKSYTKAKMMDFLVPVVKEQFQNEWKNTSFNQKEQWIHLSNTENVELQDIRQWVEKGFVFVYLNKGQLTVNIPIELKRIIQESTDYPLKIETDPFAVFYQHAEMVKKIYGSINIHYLVSVWNRYYKTPLNEENAIQLLKERNILSK